MAITDQIPPASVAALFRPFTVGSMTLPNRIVMSPMTRWKSPGGIPGPDVAAYYRRRAENGCGLIITEGTTVDHPVASYSVRVPRIDRQTADAWRKVVDGVHDAGGCIAVQLWHVGSMRAPGQDYPNPHLPSASPSGLYRPGKPPNAEPLTQQGIRDITQAFADAAGLAQDIGFDAIDLHGGHGYIFDQFFWPALNHREDDYGGDVIGRTRFAVETLQAIRAKVGPDYPIFFRFSQWKQQDYTARLCETPEALGEFLTILANAGVDVFDCSQRRYWEAEFEGSDLNCAGWAKTLTGKASMTVGSVSLTTALSVTDLNLSSEIADIDDVVASLDRGEFDLVAVGRAILADPEWAKKVREGRLSDLKPFDRSTLDDLI